MYNSKDCLLTSCKFTSKVSNFGKHWSAEQVHELFTPEEDSVQTVKERLLESGIDERRIVHSENKGWLAPNIPTHDAERLSQAEYHEHEHVRTGSTKIGCDPYANTRLKLLLLAHLLIDTMFLSTSKGTSTTLHPVSRCLHRSRNESPSLARIVGGEAVQCEGYPLTAHTHTNFHPGRDSCPKISRTAVGT